MNPGVVIVAAASALAAVGVWREIRKGRAFEREREQRREREAALFRAFAAKHDLEAVEATEEIVLEHSRWARAVDGVLSATGTLAGHRAFLLFHWGTMLELSVSVGAPDVPDGVWLAPAPQGKAQEDYYCGLAAPSQDEAFNQRHCLHRQGAIAVDLEDAAKRTPRATTTFVANWWAEDFDVWLGHRRLVVSPRIAGELRPRDLEKLWSHASALIEQGLAENVLRGR